MERIVRTTFKAFLRGNQASFCIFLFRAFSLHKIYRHFAVLDLEIANLSWNSQSNLLNRQDCDCWCYAILMYIALIHVHDWISKGLACTLSTVWLTPLLPGYHLHDKCRNWFLNIIDHLCLWYIIAVYFDWFYMFSLAARWWPPKDKNAQWLRPSYFPLL